MDGSAGAFKEVAVPVSIFATLRRELTREAGALPTIHALHAAGYGAGAEAAAGFRSSLGRDVGEMGRSAFWTSLCRFLSQRGWGTLTHEAPHGGVGLLTSPDWVESGGDEVVEEGCSFTTGFLSGLLSDLSGGPIAVLEVTCRGRESERCAFAFGSEAAIHALYGELMDGAELTTALAAL